jgi:type II secretory pathway component PulF
VLRLVEWNADLRARTRQAVTYPLVLLAVLALIGILTGLFTLPPILALMANLKVPLPLVTRVFLALGHAVGQYGLLLLALGAAAWAGCRYLLARPGPRLRWDSALLALPVAGRLISRTGLARFAQAFAAQHQAGVPVLAALRSCEELAGNARLARAVAGLRLGVEQGESLAGAAARTGQFPQAVLRMLALGESTGALDEALGRVAAQFDAEVAESVRLGFAVLDPVLKVAMAGLLLFVGSAILLPLYALIGGIRG